MAKTLDFAGEYRARAFVAYIKSEGADAGHRITHSYKRSVSGLKYVLLTENSNVRAVYRVKQDGSLRRLTRWPRKLDDAVPRITRKSKEAIVQSVMQDFMAKSFGNPEAAENLVDQWLVHANELECCEDHAHELSSLSPKEIRTGREAGYLDKPLSIDAIREYKHRLGLVSVPT